jgi:prepilin-type N-terminal cleavage/methylation domain-containing protein
MEKNHRQQKNSRKGFTLVEVLVAMGIFVIVIAIATGGFVNSLRTQRQVASLISAQSNASLVLEQMAREIRTGFLFCHDADNNTNVNDNCNNPPYSDQFVENSGFISGCTPIDSGYSYPSAPDSLPNGDLPMWDCPSLDYFNAQGEEVNYSRQNGALVESNSSVSTSTFVSITGDSVTVKDLHFIIFGNMEGDAWTPRVTIVIGVVPSSTDPAVNSDVLNLETTVSGRTIDCSTNGNTTSC